MRNSVCQGEKVYARVSLGMAPWSLAFPRVVRRPTTAENAAGSHGLFFQKLDFVFQLSGACHTTRLSLQLSWGAAIKTKKKTSSNMNVLELPRTALALGAGYRRLRTSANESEKERCVISEQR